ncbi:mCG1043891, partial [Mus musculus]
RCLRGSGCEGPAKPRRRRQAAAGAGCTGHRSDPSIAQNTKFMQTQSPPSESSRIGKLNSIVSFNFFFF